MAAARYRRNWFTTLQSWREQTGCRNDMEVAFSTPLLATPVPVCLAEILLVRPLISYKAAQRHSEPICE